MNLFLVNNPYIIMKINGISYRVEIFISMSDSENISFQEGNSKKILSEFIYQKILAENSQKPSVDEIMRQDDSFFNLFIDELLQQNEYLKMFYEEPNQNESCCDCFIQAIKNQYRESNQFILRSLSLILASNLTLNIEITEEIKKIISSQERWGECGWTQHPLSIIGFFYNPPENSKDANDKMEIYCTENGIQYILDRLAQLNLVNQYVFDEAVFCYKNSKYYSAVCLLFSLIDGIIFSFEKKIGLKGIEKFNEKISDNQENLLGLFYKAKNIYACLKKVFKHGGNFEIQPDIINRNFLLHGQLKREVTRLDFNQIVLLYYNLISLYNNILKIQLKK